ncbi:MAG TPA: hypothetical protein VEI02_13740 [Planctomycetota bacterium]|nr:hypothetical protein [Planctomycetota bacterium]
MIRTARGVLAVCAATAFASAQADFVVVNIGPAPDEIYYADLDNVPGVAATPIVGLATNSVRGLDLLAEKTGWYVSTASTPTTAAGVYRIDDGASTFAGPLPFASASVCGFTYGPGEAFAYWIADPPVGEDVLFRIDFDGTVTTIGALTVPGVPTPVVQAAACNPATGLLYIVETTSDMLYVVDQVTAAASPVGALGVNASSVGGMDFALDGTNRLFYVNQTSVYVINVATGAVGPGLGTLPNLTTSIAAIPSRTTLKTSPFVMGTNISVSLSGGAQNDLFTIFASSAPSFLQVPGLGVVRIDPLSAFVVANSALPASGTFSIGAFLPVVPGLAGVAVHLQSATVLASNLTTRLTNHVVAVIQ